MSLMHELNLPLQGNEFSSNSWKTCFFSCNTPNVILLPPPFQSVCSGRQPIDVYAYQSLPTSVEARDAAREAQRRLADGGAHPVSLQHALVRPWIKAESIEFSRWNFMDKQDFSTTAVLTGNRVIRSCSFLCLLSLISFLLFSSPQLLFSRVRTIESSMFLDRSSDLSTELHFTLNLTVFSCPLPTALSRRRQCVRKSEQAESIQSNLISLVFINSIWKFRYVVSSEYIVSRLDLNYVFHIFRSVNGKLQDIERKWRNKHVSQ
jgi:hypothetical protein